jgi:DNA-directed RNA polymerase subunit RPC12/RpoP
MKPLHAFDPVANPPNGINQSYHCELCKKSISKEEATESSFKLRRLYSINDPSNNVWECFMHNICLDCLKKFETSTDFDEYLEWYNNLPVYTVKG